MMDNETQADNRSFLRQESMETSPAENVTDLQTNYQTKATARQFATIAVKVTNTAATIIENFQEFPRSITRLEKLLQNQTQMEMTQNQGGHF